MRQEYSMSSPASDPVDELTAFSIERKPANPYLAPHHSNAPGWPADRCIAVSMSKKLFSKADEESIDIVDRAITDLRKLEHHRHPTGPKASCSGRPQVALLLAGTIEQRVYTSISRPVLSARSNIDASGSARRSLASAAGSLAPQPQYARGGGRRQIHDEPLSAGARRCQH